MKRIIYGGSFDPIHKGHLLAAKSALEKVNADLVYFVPCFSSPDSKKFKAEFKDRVAMINLAIKANKKYICSEVESNFEGISYTYKTLEYFKKQFPNDEFYILIGTDQYSNIESWVRIDYLRANAKFIIVNRSKGINLKNPNDILIENFNVNCASRDLILNPSKEYLDQTTIDYINENGIYWLNRLEDNHLTEYRIGHSIAVAEMARKIGEGNKYPDIKSLWVAGIYHDIAKDYPKEWSEDFVKKYIPDKVNAPSWKVLHSYIGAYILEHKYFFTNKKILSGIYNHTIVEDDSIFNKIIYCADKLVPRNDDTPQQRAELDKIIIKCTKNIDLGYQELREFLKKTHK